MLRIVRGDYLHQPNNERNQIRRVVEEVHSRSNNKFEYINMRTSHNFIRAQVEILFLETASRELEETSDYRTIEMPYAFSVYPQELQECRETNK
jgi:hypothetical protein